MSLLSLDLAFERMASLKENENGLWTLAVAHEVGYAFIWASGLNSHLRRQRQGRKQ